jgi:hypothetical protein
VHCRFDDGKAFRALSITDELIDLCNQRCTRPFICSDD